jgi:hypothetical protein
MAKDTGFTFQELSEVLKYDGQTGVFTWLATINSRAKSGQRAGVWQRMQNGKDYYSITYKGRKISGSQLAWLLHYGEWPDRSVFFVDKNSRNLQISNLKLADHKAIRVTKEDGTVGYEMTKEQVRHYGLVRNYNISLTEYARMFSEQNGVCAICSQPESSKMPGRKTDASEPRVRDLSVDHDHKTGAVRGLLCNSCNHMLGEARDNEQVLLAGADYIRRHRVGK